MLGPFITANLPPSFQPTYEGLKQEFPGVLVRFAQDVSSLPTRD